MNILAKIVLGAVAIAGSVKLFSVLKAKAVSDSLEINIINPRIHKIDPNPLTGGIEIRTDVELRNPKRSSLSLRQPFVQILSKGESIASTPVSSKVFLIRPESGIKLDTISLKLGWTKILSILTSLKIKFPENTTSFIQKITYILSNTSKILSSLDLQLKYSTYADDIYYSTTEKIGTQTNA